MVQGNPIIVKSLLASVGVGASVSAGSNFFATGVTFTSATNDLFVGQNGWLWAQYASATSAGLELVIDDGSASVVVALVQINTATTAVVTSVLYDYAVQTNAKYKYNFSPDKGSSANILDVWFVLAFD